MISWLKSSWIDIKSHGLVIRNSGMYLLAVGLNRGMSFIMLPLLTVFLDPSEYGIISLASILIGFLKCLIGFNPSLYVIVNFYKNTRQEIAGLITNLLVLTLLSSVVLLIPFYLVASRIWKFGSQWPLYTIVVFITAMLIVIEAFVLTLIQMEKKGRTFFWFSLISAVLQFGLVVAFVIGLKWNWQGKLLGDLIAEVVICLILLVYLFKHYPQKSGISWHITINIILFSLPLLPHAVSLWGMNFVDRFFLERIEGIESVGLYSAAYTLGLGLMLVYDALQRAWQPFFFEALEKNETSTKLKIARFTWIYFAGAFVLFFIAIALAFLLKPLLFGVNFQLAIRFVPLIFLGYTFQGMYRVIAGHLYQKERNLVLAAISISTALLNVVLNYWLITANGIMGAAQSTAITFGFMFVVTSIFVARSNSLPLFYFLNRQQVTQESVEIPHE